MSMGISVSIFSILILLEVLSQCGAVQFYNYPVPIPRKSLFGNSFGGNSRQGRSNDLALEDPAVQFLVSNDQDGSYHFGYDTGGNPTSYREEIREKSGRVVGRYAYVDPDGILRVTEYVADSEGYRSTESQHIIFDTSDLQVIGPIPKPIRK